MNIFITNKRCMLCNPSLRESQDPKTPMLVDQSLIPRVRDFDSKCRESRLDVSSVFGTHQLHGLIMLGQIEAVEI